MDTCIVVVCSTLNKYMPFTNFPQVFAVLVQLRKILKGRVQKESHKVIRIFKAKELLC